ncbi:hypothetical protein VTN00DRAFT_6652 [Thermoascus crustaceus]|uniref:uncharacterized protein n=1 Tax=Thermoascus crustaceus TaxID=5088 RepID=UPI0037430F4F
MLVVFAFVSLLSLCYSFKFPFERRGDHVGHAGGFPGPHITGLAIHDPSIIKVGGSYYAYGVGPHISIFRSPSLDGPWQQVGTVLDGPSIIKKGDNTAPWAPTVVQHGDTFYCYYSVSQAGCRDSAIGVATSKKPGPGGWVDHGLIVQSGNGEGGKVHPFDKSNTIDPHVFIDGNKGYLTFGSYWTGVWQVPLAADLKSVLNPKHPDARNLVYEPKPLDGGGASPNPLCRDETGSHPVEGATISFRDGWYYLWYSHGRCCELDPNALPATENLYNIRVGRSRSPQGPFVDRNGVDLVKGGGTIVYASNGPVIAPGGQGVLTDGDTDILYYHYLDSRKGLGFWDAQLGYNPLKYENGWPVAV